ncbi:MAG: glycosyltransferase family 4 protein [Chloroflexi bacterium]|nr:MAG: glycosyltransferase family 4 protein [Chloroflexota bacterium]
MAAQALRIVVPRFGTEVVGGSESLARRLADALASRGWRIEVFTTTAVDEATWRGDLAREERTAAGYLVRRFPVRWRRRPAAFHQATRAFFRLPSRIRPEPIWLRAQGPYAPGIVAALAQAEGMPTLFTPYLFYPTLYGLPAAPHPRLLIPAAHDERPLRLAAVARVIGATDGLWYGTPEERELVERVHPAARGVPHAVGTVGVEITSGDPQRFRARFALAGPVLVYGGRATPGKGIDVMLAAVERLRRRHPDATLVLAGHDHVAAPAQKGVVATGNLDDRAWHDALAAAVAVVVPSPMESLSMLALEAWAAGRPCLLNAASPVLRGQLERSGGGLAFSGPAELAEAARSLLEDPAAADRMGRAGRAYVEANHRWDAVMDRLASLLVAPSR